MTKLNPYLTDSSPRHAWEEGYETGASDTNEIAKQVLTVHDDKHLIQVGMLETQISDLERQVGRQEFTIEGFKVQVNDLQRLNGNQSGIIDSLQEVLKELRIDNPKEFEAGRCIGFEEGRNFGFDEMVTHFIKFVHERNHDDR